jgi:hypothetical protein
MLQKRNRLSSLLISPTSRRLSHQGKCIQIRYETNLVDNINSYFLRKEPTSLRYYGDGTGRDSYVVKDWGGYVVNYAATNVHTGHFYKSLRSGSQT